MDSMEWRIYRFKERETENFICDGMFLEVKIDIADDFTDGVILGIKRIEAKRILL